METYYQRVKVELQAQVDEIRYENQHFTLSLVGDINNKFCFDTVVLCTGSMAGLKATNTNNGYEILRKLGHMIINPYPCLVQLRGSESFYKSISGVRCSSKISVEINQMIVAEEEGELQLTDQGISGIVVFQISSFVTKALTERKKVWVHIDFLPDMELEEYKKFYKIRLLAQGYKTAEEFLQV
jgi:predicted flavoprotein YhiN